MAKKKSRMKARKNKTYHIHHKKQLFNLKNQENEHYNRMSDEHIFQNEETIPYKQNKKGHGQGKNKSFYTQEENPNLENNHLKQGPIPSQASGLSRKKAEKIFYENQEVFKESKPNFMEESIEENSVESSVERARDDLLPEDLNFKKDTLLSEEESEIGKQEQGRYSFKNKNTAFHRLDVQEETNPLPFKIKNHKKRMRKQIDKLYNGEKEIYAPSFKAMGNDGMIAQAGFNDKAFYNAPSEDEKDEDNRDKLQKKRRVKNSKDFKNKVKSNEKENKASQEASEENLSSLNKHSKQKKYFKSNFNNEEYTRNTDKKLFQNARDTVKEKAGSQEKVQNKAIPKVKEHSKKADKKFRKQEKKILKLQHKKQTLEKKFKNKNTDNLPSKGAMIAVGAVNRYLEGGKEDNAGVNAAYKTTDSVENLARKAYRQGKKKALKRQKKIVKLGKNIKKQEKKLFFKRNMEEFKKSAEYQNTSKLRQFFRRRQYKKQIQKKYKENIKNKVKKSLIEGSKKVVEFIREKSKKMVFLTLLAAGIFFILFQAGSMVMNIGTGMVGNTISTTYLSSEETLKNINQDFLSLEQGLQEEMENVEQNYPGYDEYIIKGKEKIGHNVHELLSYITSRYGVVKEVSEIKGELQQLFKQMYSLTYKEEIEIRYRTITSEDGESHKEAYEYKKLIVSLEKREMDTIIREVFRSYPDNLSHYETLLASKGNMELAFGSGNGNFSEIVDNPDFKNPGLEFSEESVKRIVSEAEKHIGKRYVFGANGPNNFDCSSFVCWVYTHSGIKNMPRTTAWGIYKDYCNPVSQSEAKAGDIIFFKGTYNSGSPISHVGIYVGNGYMIHAGDPIKYARIDTPYWIDHFYSFGRPR